MADFQATKQHNISSDMHSIVNHPKTNQPTVTFPTTPVAPSLSEGFTTGEMAKLKKSLDWPPVWTNQISHRYFFQASVTLIVHHAMLLEELRQKGQEVLAHQRVNAKANPEKAKIRANQMKAQVAERTQH